MRPISRVLKLLAICAGLTGSLALVGAGVCDLSLQHAPFTIDVGQGLTEAKLYKGHTKFISAYDFGLCYISPRVAFYGIGGGLILGFLRFLIFRDLPHR